MLHSAKKTQGLAVVAQDGAVGHIHDLYFDDAKWTVRYLVVDAGGWLTGRQVLLPPLSVAAADWNEPKLSVRLSRRQIEESPGTDVHRPVSRQHEAELFRHYGYPDYWNGPYLWGYTAMPVMLDRTQLESAGEREARAEERAKAHAEDAAQSEDSRLRSCAAVSGYHIRTADGHEVGHVEDFLFEDRDWSIQLIEVDTRNWWPGRHVLLSPERVESVDWAAKDVRVRLTQKELEASPEFDSMTPPGEGRPHDLYRRPARPLDLS